MSLLPIFTEPLSPGEGIRIGDYSHTKIVASSSDPMKLLSVCGALMSLGICFVFQRLARVRDRSMGIARTLGLFCFVLGSVGPYFGLSEFAKAEVMEARGLSGTFGGMEHAYGEASGIVLLSVVFSMMAYFLMFHRSSNTRSIQTKEQQPNEPEPDDA